MPAFVFLFSIGGLQRQSSPYNLPALTALFAALLSDQDDRSSFSLLQGDLLLHNLAYRIARVESDVQIPGKRLPRSGSRNEGDVDLYATLIADFCDALAEQWNSVDSEELWAALGRRDVFALAVSQLGPEPAQDVDRGLSGRDDFLDTFELDPGNPIQQEVTLRGLSPSLYYRRRELLFDPLRTEDPFDPPALNSGGDEWFAALPFAEARYLTEAERESVDVEWPWPHAELTARGARSLELLTKRNPSDHMQLLAKELSWMTSDPEHPFVVDTSVMSRAAEAIVEEAKMTNYVLDPTNPQSAPKAKFFREVLGIEQRDWRHLAAQLKTGLADAQVLRQTRSTEWGVRYEVVSNVLGLNGATAAVCGVWQLEAGAAPRFVTAYPAKKTEKAAAAPPRSSVVVDAALTGDARWEELWRVAQVAGQQASAEAIPTPMRVAGQLYREGAFGWASIAVRDARTGFARWLVQSAHGELRRGKGAVVPAPGHFVDRARAYAEAFADVLSLNGIDATVETYLD